MAYKDDVLKELDEGYAAFKNDIDGLTDDEMLRVWLGDWNTRDLLAHVAGWHREMGAALERISRGERPVPEGMDYSDGDAWNARFADAKSAMEPEQVLNELESSFQFYRQAVASIPEDRFEQGRTADRIAHTSGVNHYKEHGEQIREWRKNL
jgi:hypothetical protein